MKFIVVSMRNSNTELSNRRQVPKCRNYWSIATFPLCALSSSKCIYKF